MSVTISEAMHLDGLSGCKIIAGRKGIDREIKTVTIMEVPEPTKWLKGGELLLTSLYPIKDNEQALEGLVKELDQMGSSGLAIKVNQYFVEIPDIIIREGNRLNFPIIQIEKDLLYLDIMTPLMTVILKKNSPASENTDELFHWVSEMAMQGKGLNALVEAMMKILKNDITVESENPFIRISSQKKMPPLDVSVKNQLKKEKRPIRVNRLLNTQGISCIMAPLILNKELQGYITCWETERRFQKQDFVIMERAVPLIALEFLKVKVEIEVEQKYRNEFLAEFLAGNMNDSNVILEKARIYNWDLERNLQLLILNIDQFNYIVTSLDNNEMLIQEYKRKIYGELEKIILPKCQSAIISGWSDYFVILIPVEYFSSGETEEEETNPGSVSFIEKVIKKLNERFPEVTYTAGIGRSHPGLQGMQSSYEEALQAIRIGREVWGRSQIVHFDSLGIYRFLSKFKDADEIKDLYCETVVPLHIYDKDHNSSLVSTIEEFFKNNGGLKETAEVMYIHVNTLKYRLKKIEHITGFSLGTSEGRLYLHLGLKIQNIVKLL